VKVCTTDTRIICDFRENRHGEGRNFRVRVNEIVLKVVEWECDSLRGKRDLVKTVHCDTECTICSLVSNSIRRYQENTPTEEGGVTAQPEGQRKLNQFYLLLTQTSGSNTKRCQCQHCYTVSALLHSVSAATQCQRCSTVSALLHSVSTATQCQRCYTVSALLHSVSAAPRCERCYTVSVPPHSVSAAYTVSALLHGVSAATQCQYRPTVSALLHSVSTAPQCQHCYTVSALLQSVSTATQHQHSSCDDKCDSRRKSKKSAIMRTSTSCDQFERTLTVTRNVGYPERELNPELLTVWRGQVTVTAATFYSLHCHQSRLFVTLEKECLERKFTFSDKPSPMNDTIHTSLGWEPDRKSDGSSCVGIPL